MDLIFCDLTVHIICSFYLWIVGLTKKSSALAGVAQSGLSANLRTKRSLVQFSGRAHAEVADQVSRRECSSDKHTLMFLSFSFSLPSPLSKKINKMFKKKTNRLLWKGNILSIKKNALRSKCFKYWTILCYIHFRYFFLVLCSPVLFLYDFYLSLNFSPRV